MKYEGKCLFWPSLLGRGPRVLHQGRGRGLAGSSQPRGCSLGPGPPGAEPKGKCTELFRELRQRPQHSWCHGQVSHTWPSAAVASCPQGWPEAELGAR